MAEPKKQIPLRLNAKLYDALAAWAEDDFRSVNGQIEMVYLQGGATTEATAWDVFLNVGKLFNYIARVFSAGSSIVNNINVIVTTFQTLSTFSLTAKN